MAEAQAAAGVSAEDTPRTVPKVVARPPPGTEARVTGPGGNQIQADASWPQAEAAEQQQQQEQQPPRVSGLAARSEAPQVQQQPGAVLTGLSTEAARQASLASSIEESTVYGRTKVIIRVPKGWWAKKGNELLMSDGSRRFVGEPLGQGCQGGVYNLVDEKGQVDQARVLKAKHRYALMTKVKREWEIGLQVANMFEPDKALPGYMMTAEGVATTDNKFVGMILERLDGHGVNKPVEKSNFCDIGLLQEQLFCVFNSLDIGQKALGFHHSDLRLSNIMELKQSAHARATSMGAGALHSHRMSDRVASGLDLDAAAHAAEAGEKGGANGGGVSENAAERLNKLRIIDYGLADFTEYYPAGHVQVGGPTHAVPKGGPLHLTLGKLHMALPLPISAEQLKLIPQVSPLERFYRSFWKNKGDIYHICWDLTRFLDGRVWPAEDERQVKLLLAFIHHCTGVRLKCWFAPREHADKDGRLQIKDRFMTFSFVQHYDGWAHVLRVRAIRLQAWFRPHNPGITAAEALTAPFFESAISANTGDEAV